MIGMSAVRGAAISNNLPAFSKRRAAGFGLALMASVPACFTAAIGAHAQPRRGNEAAGAQALSPFEAARVAFEAYPEAMRRKIQEGLVWTGDYKGGIDGEFGRMTHAAIVAFGRRIRKTGADGLLSAQDLNVLDRLAQRARTAAGYREIQDPISGITIGLPQKIFVRTKKTASGTVYEDSRGRAQISFFQVSGPQADLKRLYEDLRNVPGQKVAYGVLRNDFLVVSGERTGANIYTRAARGQAGGGAVLRGFTLTYPRAQQRVFDNLVIAISNSFQPFRLAAAADTGEVGKPALPSEFVAGTALAVAPDTYLTVLHGAGCKAPRIGKAPATVLAHDKSTGLALLRAPVGGGQPIRPVFRAAQSGQEIFTLFAETTGPIGDPRISIARGALTGDPASLRLRASMPTSGAGALLSLVPGVIAGLAGIEPQAKIAGPAPPALRPVIGPAAIESLLKAADIPVGSAGQNAAGASMAAVAAGFARALAPLSCAR